MGSKLKENIVFKASEYSKLFWNEWQLNPDSMLYNIHSIYNIKGNIDKNKLHKAISILVENNYNLRSTFYEKNEILYHKISNSIKVKLYDIAASDFEEKERLLDININNKFNLNKGALFRFVLIEHLYDDEYTFLINIHHIIVDGSCYTDLLKELESYYLEQKNDERTNKKSLDDFISYLNWEREVLNKIKTPKIVSEVTKEYFNFNLPYSKRKKVNHNQINNYNVVSGLIEGNLIDKIKKFSVENNVTIFNILMNAWSVLIAKYSNKKLLAITYPVTTRPKHLKNIRGAFLNVLFYLYKEQGCFYDLLKHVDISYNPNLRNDKYYSFPEQIKKIRKKINFNDSNEILKVSFAQTDLRLYTPKFVSAIEAIKTPNTGNYELLCEYQELNGIINYQINFDTSLFEYNFIYQLSEHYENIIKNLLDNPQKQISDIYLLTKNEYQQIVYEWNKTETPYPKDKTIQQLFEEQVKKNPENIAVVFEDNSLTYRKLNARSNQLAHFIRDTYKEHIGSEVKGDTLIGIYINRSPDMIVGILGILKSGAAYVPFDTADPKERLKFKIKDCGCRMVLTSSSSVKDLLFLTETDTLPVSVDSIKDELINYPADNPVSINKATDLAYVIYTSGSTGQPKGVMNLHRNVINFLTSLNSIQNVQEPFNTLLVSNYAFDVSVHDIFSTLLYGGSLYLYDKYYMADKNNFYKVLIDNSIHSCYVPPFIINQLNELIDGNDKIYLKRILVGVEPIAYKNLTNLIKFAPDLAIINGYGPTEATICSSFFKVKATLNYNKTPIGKPLFNTTLYALDNNKYPVPIGVPGELYIGGDGLARGYLNRPELTAERFIENPFVTNEDKSRGRNLLIYRTGDIVRWLPDGNLEFIGRNDDQVKIRGFRVELGEIENKLFEHPSVSQCTVIVKEHRSGDKYLAVFYMDCNLETHNYELLQKELRTYLSDNLPDYMIPSAFVNLEEMPLNTSGKVDRKALANISIKSAGQKQDISVPHNEVEKEIAKIWQDILDLDLIDVNSNFFELGGTSLTTVKVKRQIKEQLDVDIEVLDIFAFPTVSKLAACITQKQSKVDNTGRKKLKLEHCQATTEDVAIIGLSGAFPQSASAEKLWSKLRNGENCISLLNKDECLELGVDESLTNLSNYIGAGGIMPDKDKFDAEFWNISSRDAEMLDPQIRKFLEYTWLALDNAGCLNNLQDSKIGVFAGAADSEYLSNNLTHNDTFKKNANFWEVNSYANSKFIASRVNYFLNLNGPGVYVDTACSSGLVAVIEGCKSLKLRESDTVIAGGITVFMPQNFGYVYKEGMIHSTNGSCSPFDESACGTVVADGLGVVILKRLSDAKKNNDKILAVIKGYSINNDGNNKVGYTAPSIGGQTECILAAQEVAGITSDKISYVECHATATNLGDPIEIKALDNAFKANTGSTTNSKCYLGSVKANIGHTDRAAGIAGLIKVIFMLRDKIIPPQINYLAPNPKLSLEKTRFKITKKQIVWKTENTSARLMAGVSSFGIGGTNAHVIVEEYKMPSLKTCVSNRPYECLYLSSNSPEMLDKNTTFLADYLDSNHSINLSDLAYSLYLKKTDFKYRRLVITDDLKKVVNILKNKPSSSCISGSGQISNNNIGFMFTGQGSQYVGMAEDLYSNDKLFKENIDKCAEIVIKRYGYDFRTILYPIDRNTDVDTINNTRYSQPILFSLEYALAQLWMSIGIKPSMMIGHSLGEYVAACISGVFSLEDALDIVCRRAYLMSKMPRGKMLVVIGLYVEEIKRLLPESISIAVINSASHIVLSGKSDQIEELNSDFKKQGITSKVLVTSHAFHSEMMRGMLAEYKEYLSTISFKEPTINFVSNITGDWITPKEAMNAEYWCQHIVSIVNFKEGVQKIIQDNTTLIEIGPGNTLKSLAKQNHVNDENIIIGGSLPDAKDNISSKFYFYREFGKLWVNGHNIDFSILYDSSQHSKLQIPFSYFKKNRYWIMPDKGATENIQEKTLKKQPFNNWFYEPTWTKHSLGRGKKRDIGNTLIFTGRSVIGDELKKILDSTEQTVFVVNDADTFSFDKDNKSYSINFTNSDNYNKLFESLASESIDIDNIIHLSLIDSLLPKSYEVTMNSSDYYNDIGFYSLMNIVTAASNNNYDSFKFLVVTNYLQNVTGNEQICPEKSTMLGMLQCIPKEFSKILCKSVDLEIVNDTNSLDFANRVLDEIKVMKTYTFESIAYRGTYRWVSGCSNITLPEEKLVSEVFKKNGIYLITGGLGGIGLNIAKLLAKKYSANLILVSRKQMPHKNVWLSAGSQSEKTILSLTAIDRFANSLEVISGDITSKNDLKQICDFIEKKYRKLDGIIHCAGLPAGQAITLKTKDYTEKIFAPKIAGTINLHRELSKLQPELFLFCSSLITVHSVFGQSDYSAANMFLNYYCNYLNHDKKVKSISIGLDAWQDDGMFAKEMNKRLSKDLTQNGFTVKDIKHHLFDRCITDDKNNAYYISVFSEDEYWFFSDHKVNGLQTAPGTAMIALMESAYKEYTSKNATLIQEVYFLNIINIKQNETKEVFTIVSKKEEDIYTCFVVSKPKAKLFSEWIIHAYCKIQDAEPKKEKNPLDLNAKITELEKTQLTAKYVGRFNDVAVEYGPRWKCKNKIINNNNCGVVFIDLPDDFESDLELYSLHPSLLDFATSLIVSQFIDQASLPFSYSNMQVFAPLTKKMIAYVELNYKNDETGTVSCGVHIFDSNNNILVIIDEFSLKQIATDFQKAAGIRLPQANQSVLNTIDSYKQNISTAFTTKEGLEAFFMASSLDVSETLISTVDIGARITKINNIPSVLDESGEDYKDDGQTGNKYSRPDLSTEYGKPEGKVELMIANIWQKLLKIDKIGRNDNFFELGGNSLIFISFNSKSKEQGYTFNLSDVYQHSTITELSKLAESKSSSNEVDGASYDINISSIHLSPMQNRVLELMNKDKNDAIDFFYFIDYPVSEKQFKSVVEILRNSHINLNIRFVETDKGWDIAYDPDNEEICKSYYFNQERTDYKDRLADTLRKLHKSLNFTTRLTVCAFFYFPEIKGGYLYFNTLHSICDGFSLNILLEEFLSLLSAEKQQKYKIIQDHTAYLKWLNCFKRYEDNFEYEHKKWINILSLPNDYIAEQKRVLHSDMVNYFKIVLDKKELQELKEGTLQRLQTSLAGAAILAFAFGYKNLFFKPEYLLANYVLSGRMANNVSADFNNIVGMLALHAPIKMKLSNLKPSLNIIKIVNKILSDVVDAQFSYNSCIWSKKVARNKRNTMQKLDPKVLLNFRGSYASNQSNESEDLKIDYKKILTGNQSETQSNFESNYLLNASFEESDKGFGINFYYSTKHFNKEQIDAFFGDMEDTFESLKKI